MGQAKYANGFNVTSHRGTVEEPLSWKKPARIFVCSMSDLFHPDVQTDFIRRVYEAMGEAPWHTFQLLTKRSDRLSQLDQQLPWKEHIWAGVSVENGNYLDRIDHLRQTSAHIKFLSLEPLLGPLPNLDLDGIDWVIVGGESGPKARRMQGVWVMDIRDQCIQASVPFFFKQWGGVRKKKHGRLLQGRTWDQMPR